MRTSLTISAANEAAPPRQVVRNLHAAKAAVRHAASVLGRVTHAANNHPVTVECSRGAPKTVMKRDASGPSAPKAKRRSFKPASAPNCEPTVIEMRVIDGRAAARKRSRTTCTNYRVAKKKLKHLKKRIPRARVPSCLEQHRSCCAVPRVGSVRAGRRARGEPASWAAWLQAGTT